LAGAQAAIGSVLRAEGFMRIALLWAVSVLATGAATGARAYCSEPSVPSRSSKPEKPEKPDTPWCANSFTGRHTCSDWEIQRYNAEVEEYNDDLETYQQDLERYLRRLRTYVEEAQEYARCEVRSLDN
jgi:hypothetical protein